MSATATVGPAAALEEPRPAAVPSSSAKKRKRTPFLVGAMTVVAASVAGGFYIAGYGQESTDDATVEGRVINVAARV